MVNKLYVFLGLVVLVFGLSLAVAQENIGEETAQLEDLIEEKKHYEYLYNLSEKELKETGYPKGREQIKRILEKYEERIRNIEPKCEEVRSRVVQGNVSGISNRWFCRNPLI